MQLTIVDTNGPLFVLRESPDVSQFLTTHYPQFLKRSLGWQLSVEEVFYLQQRHDEHTVGRAPGPDVEVGFASASAVEQYEVLRETYATDCVVYARLTQHHGYRLRHGSQFGSNYIGYTDLRTHGECLFFTGPLTNLERVRAVRIARSVGKDAVMACVTADASNVELTFLGTDCTSDTELRPTKLRRQQ